jgi:6-phosphofructokinase
MDAGRDACAPRGRKRTMKKNVIVAQSGGPSPVINASLQGVIDGCLAYPDHIDHIYAGWHGIEGVLLEELIDISQQPRKEIELLRYTPAAGAIGTCRYKLKGEQAEDYDRIIEVMRAHNVGFPGWRRKKELNSLLPECLKP